MSKPLRTENMPHAICLEPGDYDWCACGRSGRPPFCDGSHAGSGLQPVKFTVTPGMGMLWLCGCRRSRNKPFCDGQHNRL